MRTVKKFIIAAGFVLTLSLLVEAKEWRGIRPLHSTRADVERLLGQPVDSCRCAYETKQERVYIVYAGGRCEPNTPYKYDVPRDTVFEVIVQPKTRLMISELQLDKSKYKKAGSSAHKFISYYINREEGVIIEVGTCEEKVTSIIYTPPAENDIATCEADWNFDPSPPRKVDEYAAISFLEEKKRLDDFMQVLEQEPELNGYVIAYGGQGTSKHEAQARLDQAKKYITSTHGLSAARLVTIYGGYRDKPTVELFIWPRGWREYYGEVPSTNCLPRRASLYVLPALHH